MQGEVVYLYAFDVANEIDTGRIREILASQPTPFEIRPDQRSRRMCRSTSRWPSNRRRW